MLLMWPIDLLGSDNSHFVSKLARSGMSILIRTVNAIPHTPLTFSLAKEGQIWFRYFSEFHFDVFDEIVLFFFFFVQIIGFCFWSIVVDFVYAGFDCHATQLTPAHCVWLTIWFQNQYGFIACQFLEFTAAKFSPPKQT